MNDPAGSGRGIRQGISFKSRGKPRGMKPTGGIQAESPPRSQNILGIYTLFDEVKHLALSPNVMSQRPLGGRVPLACVD